MRSTFIHSAPNVLIRYIKYVALLTVTILIIGGHIAPAYAGPALYFRILSPPRIEEMSFSQCAGKAYRTISLRVKGHNKADKGYALG